MRREVRSDDGTVLSYLVSEGVEPAVVILHGLAGSSREFLPTLHALPDRKVVLLDLRGHGSSTRTPTDLSRAAFVLDVVKVIEAETNRPVDLVGQSMGAHTAMLVAAAHPNLVHKLVLLESGEGGGSAEETTALGDFFRSWPVPFATREEAVAVLGDGPLTRAWVADLEQRPDGLYPRFEPEVMEKTIAAVAVPRWEEWESVQAPTLVIYADGGMFTAEQQTLFIERGRNVATITLCDASHDAHLDAFDQWIVVLRTFLSSP